MSDNRILLIENQAYLSIDLGRLKIQRKGQPDHFVAARDIAVLVIHHPAVTLTQRVISELSEKNTITIFTDNKHQPTTVCFPIIGSTQTVPRLHQQIKIKDSTAHQQLWKSIIQCKISGQNSVLKMIGHNKPYLPRLAKTTLSGDIRNNEAQAASYYWKHWLGDGKKHKRIKQGAYDNLNISLNFGYAILRSLIARCISIAGLNPSLGIHHRNMENPFNLCDDFIEPYRFLVDQHVLQLTEVDDFNSQAKKKVLGFIESNILLSNQREYRLSAAIQETVDSYVRVIESKQKTMVLPIFKEKSCQQMDGE